MVVRLITRNMSETNTIHRSLKTLCHMVKTSVCAYESCRKAMEMKLDISKKT